MKNKEVGLTEMLELMHKQAVNKNATTVVIKGHNCKNLDGFCYTITVQTQDECGEHE